MSLRVLSPVEGDTVRVLLVEDNDGDARLVQLTLESTFGDDMELAGADTAARFLEIGIAESDGIEFIVHAMPARDKFLDT